MSHTPCDACPFAGCEPVPPQFSDRPRVVLVTEHPGPEEAFKTRIGIGRVSRKLAGSLKKIGIDMQHDCHIIPRVACYKGRGRLTISVASAAAACCEARFQQAMAKCSTLPTIFLGDGATAGVLTKKEIRECRLLPQINHHRYTMVTQHPAGIYFGAAPKIVPYEAALEHFGRRALRGHVPAPWPQAHQELDTTTPQLLKSLGDVVAWDVETVGVDPYATTITCIGFHDGKQTIVIPWDSYSTESYGDVNGLDKYGKLGDEARQAALEVLSSNRLLLAHNGAYDVQVMTARRHIARNDYDTLHAHAILWPETPHNLESTGAQLLDLPTRWKTIFKRKDDDAKGVDAYADSAAATLREYCGRDCIVTYGLWKATSKLLREKPCGEELFSNAMRNAGVALRSVLWGWSIDKDRLKDLTEKIVVKEAEQLAAIKPVLEKIADEVTEPWVATANTNSSKQLGKIIYELLDEPVASRTATGAPSTDGDTLVKLSRKSVNPLTQELCKAITAMRKTTKLRTTYVPMFSGCSVARPSIHVTGQVSGRWSYTSPPLQTVPPIFKPVLVARPGNWIVMADYSQLELRIIVLLSGDKPLLKAYAAGADVHTLNAADVFNVPVEQAKQKVYRSPAKTFVFQLNYSPINAEIATTSLHTKLSVIAPNLTLRMIRASVDRWYSAHPELIEWKRELFEQAVKNDYVEEPFNHRRRYFYGLVKDTEVFNFPLQSGGAAMVDKAIQGIDAELDHSCEGVLLQRHDEIGLEGPDPLRLAKLLKKHMTQDITMNGNHMHFPVDFQIGKRWGELKGCDTMEDVEMYLKEAT